MKVFTPYPRGEESEPIDHKILSIESPLRDLMNDYHLSPTVYYPQIVSLFDKLDKSDDWHNDEDVCQLVTFVLDDEVFRDKLSNTTIFKVKPEGTNGRIVLSSDKHHFLSNQLDKPDHPTGPELDEFLQIIKGAVASRTDEWADKMSDNILSQPTRVGQRKDAMLPPSDALLPMLKAVTERTLLRVFENMLGLETKGLLGILKDIRGELPKIFHKQDATFTEKLRLIRGLIDDQSKKVSGLSPHYREYLNHFKITLDSLQKITNNFEKESRSSVTSSLSLLAGSLEVTQSLLQIVSSLPGIDKSSLQGVNSMLTPARQLLTQVQGFYALPPDASFIDFLSQFDAMKPLIEQCNAVYKKIQTLLSVLPTNPGFEKKWQSINRVFEDSSPERVKALNTLFGTEVAEAIRQSLSLAKKAGAYPLDKQLMVQLDWLKQQTPSLQQAFTYQMNDMGKESDAIKQLNALLDIVSPNISTWVKTKTLANMFAPTTWLSTLVHTAIPVLAGSSPVGSMALLAAQKGNDFYKNIRFDTTWPQSLRNFAKYLSQDIVKNSQDYRGIMPGGEITDATIKAAMNWWNSAPTENWAESIGQLLKSATIAHPVSQRVYQRYLEMGLGWKLYQALQEKETRAVVMNLEEIRDAMKPYISNSSLAGIAPLVDLLPMLPALNEARAEIAQIGPTTSWTEWAGALSGRLVGSTNPALQQLRNQLTNQLETWAADSLSGFFNPPVADAAVLPAKESTNINLPADGLTEADFLAIDDTKIITVSSTGENSTPIEILKELIEKYGFTLNEPVYLGDKEFAQGHILNESEPLSGSARSALAMGGLVGIIALGYAIYKVTSGSSSSTDIEESIPLNQLPIIVTDSNDTALSKKTANFNVSINKNFPKLIMNDAQVSEPFTSKPINRQNTFIQGRSSEAIYTPLTMPTETENFASKVRVNKPLLAAVGLGLSVSTLGGGAYYYLNTKRTEPNNVEKEEGKPNFSNSPLTQDGVLFEINGKAIIFNDEEMRTLALSTDDMIRQKRDLFGGWERIIDEKNRLQRQDILDQISARLAANESHRLEEQRKADELVTIENVRSGWPDDFGLLAAEKLLEQLDKGAISLIKGIDACSFIRQHVQNAIDTYLPDLGMTPESIIQLRRVKVAGPVIGERVTIENYSLYDLACYKFPTNHTMQWDKDIPNEFKEALMPGSSKDNSRDYSPLSVTSAFSKYIDETKKNNTLIEEISVIYKASFLSTAMELEQSSATPKDFKILLKTFIQGDETVLKKVAFHRKTVTDVVALEIGEKILCWDVAGSCIQFTNTHQGRENREMKQWVIKHLNAYQQGEFKDSVTGTKLFDEQKLEQSARSRFNVIVKISPFKLSKFSDLGEDSTLEKIERMKADMDTLVTTKGERFAKNLIDLGVFAASLVTSLVPGAGIGAFLLRAGLNAGVIALGTAAKSTFADNYKEKTQILREALLNLIANIALDGLFTAGRLHAEKLLSRIEQKNISDTRNVKIVEPVSSLRIKNLNSPEVLASAKLTAGNTIDNALASLRNAEKEGQVNIVLEAFFGRNDKLLKDKYIQTLKDVKSDLQRFDPVSNVKIISD